jgi:predicted MFS family arabinose efflux permease
MFTGAFGGVLSAMIMTALGDSIRKSRLGVATSIVIGANSIAAIIGVPAGLYLTHHFNWHIAFTILALLNILVLVMSVIFLPSMTTHIEPKGKNSALKIFALFRMSNFAWTIVFMCLLTMAGGFTILPFLSTYMISNVSFDPANLSFLFFLGGLATIITGPMVGMLLDKFGKQGVFMIFNFISILPVFFLTIYPLTSHVMALVVSTAFFIFSSARHVSAIALINSKFEGNIRGKLISINSSMQMMAGSLSTVVAGHILYKSEGALVNFDIVGIVAIMAIILCILVAFTLDND